MFARFFVSLFTFFLGCFFVHGADIERIDSDEFEFAIILLSGKIVEGDLHKLSQVVSTNNWKERTIIGFDSLGGSIYEAVRIGRYIRENGLYTALAGGSHCYSACFFSFIGGIDRRVFDGTKLGVHQFYGGEESAGDVQTVTQYLTSELLEYTSSMGVSIETMTIAFRTFPQDMYVFSEHDLRRLNIVTGDALPYSERVGSKSPVHPRQDCPMEHSGSKTGGMLKWNTAIQATVSAV